MLGNNNQRQLSYGEAIREALEQMLQADPNVIVIGEGVPDPKTIFGTTKGLSEKFGSDRVMDMPVAENGMTGVLIGAAVTGLRPVLIHQRVDFSLYALDQVINNAAKWYSMFGGQKSCPIVIRMIIGRGWGQGNQHSQNLQSLYAHIPGLKVVMPSSAYDAKGLMVAAIRDPNPVIFLEHRWLHNIKGSVPEELYEVKIGEGKNITEGEDVTIVTWSYMAVEAVMAEEYLQKENVKVDIIDIRSLSPLDYDLIKKSLKKTGRLVVVDASWRHAGFAAEIVARVCEDSDIKLKSRPVRITFPDFPSPSTPGLCRYYYPSYKEIFEACMNSMGRDVLGSAVYGDVLQYHEHRVHDVPDKNFTGPF